MVEKVGETKYTIIRKHSDIRKHYSYRLENINGATSTTIVLDAYEYRSSTSEIDSVPHVGIRNVTTIQSVYYLVKERE